MLDPDLPLALGNIGEVLIVKNLSRHNSDDIYECVADNGVPPAVSRQMRLTVECGYYIYIYIYIYIYSKYVCSDF